MHPLMPYQPLELELLEVMPHSVERQSEPGRKVFGRKLTSPLELQEHGAALPTLSQREVGIDEREGGDHEGRVRAGDRNVKSLAQLV
jgi:hypothetical protein